MPEHVIEFAQAAKDYGRKQIGPLDLEVNRGEIVGFLGPNGSGKTTSIRLILGLIRATSGSVRVNGLDPISDHVHALKNVGYSPELPNIQTFFTPGELLSLVARTLSLASEVGQEIARVLELVGLIEYRDVKVGKLSKGMVQRLSIAQAMMGRPEVLILDEPMIGLDPAGTAHLRELFREFAKKNGGTVFLSSHMMSEVQNLCDTVAIIHNGRLVQRGTIEEVTGRVLGTYAVSVEAEGLSESCISKIRSLPGVKAVRDSGRDLEIEIDGPAQEDMRPKIAEAIVNSGARLYTIKPSENLLERAYIEALGGKGK